MLLFMLNMPCDCAFCCSGAVNFDCSATFHDPLSGFGTACRQGWEGFMSAPSTIILLLPPIPSAAATNALRKVHLVDLYFAKYVKKIHVLQSIATQGEAI
jgi:hypothetical protein